MPATVKEQFGNEEDYEKVYEEAESNARGDWEIDFIEMMGERFEKFGFDMYISDKQVEILKKIAKGESDGY